MIWMPDVCTRYRADLLRATDRYGGENCEKCGGTHRKGQICPLYGE